MELSKRFGVDQDLDTVGTHDDNGLFLFDISKVQFSLEAPKLWAEIGQAYWRWLEVIVDNEQTIRASAPGEGTE